MIANGFSEWPQPERLRTSPSRSDRRYGVEPPHQTLRNAERPSGAVVSMMAIASRGTACGALRWDGGLGMPSPVVIIFISFLRLSFQFPVASR
jgi:hypothetical protein